mmetsp:Transcript_17033/g.46784  ORF Transcript_17033/g.46784 Transcript_17033/m.46784 type:complete len:271 (+) Transcript_17033:5604-6416(+)
MALVAALASSAKWESETCRLRKETPPFRMPSILTVTTRPVDDDDDDDDERTDSALIPPTQSDKTSLESAGESPRASPPVSRWVSKYCLRYCLAVSATPFMGSPAAVTRRATVLDSPIAKAPLVVSPTLTRTFPRNKPNRRWGAIHSRRRCLRVASLRGGAISASQFFSVELWPDLRRSHPLEDIPGGGTFPTWVWYSRASRTRPYVASAIEKRGGSFSVFSPFSFSVLGTFWGSSSSPSSHDNSHRASSSPDSLGRSSPSATAVTGWPER